MAPRYKPFLNRELSWLEFDQRVLDEAANPRVPLLERCKFLAITGSNLDEFFMVRVGGLRMVEARGRRRADPSGRTPSQQLAAISERCHAIVRQQYACLQDDLARHLGETDIVRLSTSALSKDQYRFLERVFQDVIYPVITPMAVDPDAPFPLLRNLTLHLAVRLAPAEGSRTPRYAVFPVAPGLERLIRIPSRESFAYVLIEDVIKLFIHLVFPGEKILECQPFRITRNADITVQEDLASDLLSGMLDVLDARTESECIRLEISENVTRRLRTFLQRALKLRTQDIYANPGPLDLSYLWSLADLQGYEEHKAEPWRPQPSPWIDPTVPMFDTLAQRDILLHHPYEQFDPIVRLLEEAAADPDVLAIKQILYRTSTNSPIVAALAHAAAMGKYVTVIVELKARFDEARNIDWARALEKAGVQVIYGIKGLKTHAKLCIVIRRENDGIRRYLHMGTGNYNESTAKLYSDISYLTCDEDLGVEASIFFNTITGFSQPRTFQHLAAAPNGLRERLLELIEAERALKKRRKKCRIMIKVNSLVDPALIQALYGASQDGVEILLNIRGICCLRPGISGVSENIRVTSIVDRHLEHSRIFYFSHGGEDRLYIGSADLMQRNLDRRVELLVPVRDKACKKRLMQILETYFTDSVKAKMLNADGSYSRVGMPEGGKPVRSQEVLYRRATRAAQKKVKQRRTAFEPHRPSADG